MFKGKTLLFYYLPFPFFLSTLFRHYQLNFSEKLARLFCLWWEW